jgi:hypothetical protein
MRNVVVAIFLIAAASFPAGAQESGGPTSSPSWTARRPRQPPPVGGR